MVAEGDTPTFSKDKVAALCLALQGYSSTDSVRSFGATVSDFESCWCCVLRAACYGDTMQMLRVDSKVQILRAGTSGLLHARRQSVSSGLEGGEGVLVGAALPVGQKQRDCMDMSYGRCG